MDPGSAAVSAEPKEGRGTPDGLLSAPEEELKMSWGSAEGKSTNPEHHWRLQVLHSGAVHGFTVSSC